MSPTTPSPSGQQSVDGPAGTGAERRRLVWLGLLLLLSAAALGAALVLSDSAEEAPPPAAGEPSGSGVTRPNVVLIYSDDQDAASIEVMDQVGRLLVEQGTSYPNAFASLPQCCPARATLLSGQYAHNHRVRENLPPLGGYTSFDGANSLPVWLQEAGYRTGWIGKYMNGYGNPARGTDPREVPPGWSEWIAPVKHTEYRLYGYTLNRNGNLESYGAGPESYQTDVFAREAEAFIEASAGRSKPFFLTVAPLAPHFEGGRVDDRAGAPRNPRPAPRHLGRFEDEPLPRPPSFNEKDVADKAAIVAQAPPLGATAIQRLKTAHRSRLESLLAVDDLVAGTVAALRRSGVLEKTILIYTADHGFLLGEHRLRGKARLYEEAVKVPLVIRGPGFESGGEDSAIVGNVDLAPTILAATGASAGLEIDGRSLLRGDPAAAPEQRPRRPGILLELYYGGRSAGLRGSRYAYLDFGNRGVELYDMRSDPFQLENLANRPQFAQIRRRQALALKGLRGCAGADCGR